MGELDELEQKPFGRRGGLLAAAAAATARQEAACRRAGDCLPIDRCFRSARSPETSTQSSTAHTSKELELADERMNGRSSKDSCSRQRKRLRAGEEATVVAGGGGVELEEARAQISESIRHFRAISF